MSFLILQPEAVRRLLFVLFWVGTACFSFGQACVVAGPLVCIPPLLFLYWKDWKNCTLAQTPAVWFFLSVFFCSVAMQYLFSQWQDISWQTLHPNIFRAFVLPFAAMECTRGEKELKWLAGAFLFAVFFQGLDGVWQYVFGFDLIKHAPFMTGRLTGSFSTYRVGDYMGIILPAACAAGLFLPARTPFCRIMLILCLLAPGIFLWIFAQARMGYAAFFTALYTIWLTSRRKISYLRDILLPFALFALLVLFGPNRISLERALADPRGELWITAWKTFLHTPWFGTGTGTYIPALQAAGLDLPINGLSMQHPHNAYLQFLVDGGIVGFFAMMFFLAGSTFWAWRQIRPAVLAECQENASLFWRLSLFFLAAWIGYLVVLAGGHDFYRTWFLSTGMTLLGIVYGACATGKKMKTGKTQGDIS